MIFHYLNLVYILRKADSKGALRLRRETFIPEVDAAFDDFCLAGVSSNSDGRRFLDLQGTRYLE
jgi:hypothetical protein